MKTITFRLKPGVDLKQSIEAKVNEHAIRAGFIVTCVGGLEQAVVRGGHLKEGAIIHPTAEIVLGIPDDVTYTRELDDDTGFPELVVTSV